MQPLPKTKFLIPSLHRELIPRATLTRRLQKELPVSRLLLLSASAGYGKTTLCASLPASLPDYPLAWVSLDKEDNDILRFFICLAEALGILDDEIKKGLYAQLPSFAVFNGTGFNFQTVRQWMTALINAILASNLPPFILVLDDLHEIDQPLIYEALDYLLDHQPPTLHLVVATRYQPPLHLNRLKARQQITELGTDDLRFSFSESWYFLNEMFKLGLTTPFIEELQRKTEGWPVGMVLLTSHFLSLHAPSDPSDRLSMLLSIGPSTFNYLAEEILSNQPVDLQSFMLETSVLNALTPELCQKITTRQDSADILERLFINNLFLNRVNSASESQPAVYRYHSIFAQFLQSELQKDKTRWINVHQRAALAENEPSQVIYHLIASENWVEAALKIEENGEEFIQNGYQSIVSGWIQGLPENFINRRYRLMYILGLSSLLSGDLTQANTRLLSALQLLEGENDPITRGQVLVRLASLAFIGADFNQCTQLINQAEPYIQGLDEQIDFLMLRASLALFCRSDWQQAETDLRRALQIVSDSDNPRLWYICSIYLAPEFSVIPGLLDLLEAFCKSAQLRYGDQMTPFRLGIEDTWAFIHLRRGRLQAALDMAMDVLRVKKYLGGYPFLGMNACLTAAAALTGLGNYHTAEGYLQQVEEMYKQADLNRALSAGAFFPHGKLHCLSGDMQNANRLLQAFNHLPLRLPLAEVLQPMLSGLVDLKNQHYLRAEKTLVKAVSLQSKEWVSSVYGSARLLLAFLYTQWGKTREALIEMDSLLADCERGHCPGLILQDMPLAAPLLRLCIKKGVQINLASVYLQQMGLDLEEKIESNPILTGRQVEILKKMAAGYSNQAIADELVLSLATVKSHGVHILNRLGVSSRMEAVAKARLLGIIS